MSTRPTPKADATEAVDTAPAETETEQAAPAETTEQAAPAVTFEELVSRLFRQPAPSYADPVIITAEMRQEMNAAAAEYSEANDQAALIQFHARADREWGAVVARELAAKLAS